MRWNEVISKRTIVSLVMILGLAAFGIAYLSIRYGSRPLHPERSRVEATAWFDHGELYIDVTLVELDVNDTYCFLQISLNPHPGKEPMEETTFEASQTFGGCDRMSEGDVIHIHFLKLGSNFKLRDENRVDTVLPFYILVEKKVEGHVFYDHKYVEEIEFSIEVQGEIPPEYMLHACQPMEDHRLQHPT